MQFPFQPLRAILYGTILAAVSTIALAQDITLLATERGILANTSMELADGQFTLGAPGIVVNNEIYKQVQPKVEVIDDKNLALRYPNGAEAKVSIVDSKVTFIYSGLPADATGLGTGMTISREAAQGSRYGFNDDPLDPFPEEDSRRILFENKARRFILTDPQGNGIAISTPELMFKLKNKGEEGWSQFGCDMFYQLADHPGETEFTFEFRPITPK